MPDRLKVRGEIDSLSSAPVKKWQPYGGYTPKRDRVVRASVPASVASAGSESEVLFLELTRLADACTSHMDKLSQVMYQGTGVDQIAMQGVTSAYMQSCSTYKGALLDLQEKLTEAAGLKLQEEASTEKLTSSHVAVQAQVDMIRFGYKTKLRNLQAQLGTSAVQHQSELMAVQKQLSVAVPQAKTGEIRAVLERASKMELSAAQGAPVDELQARVLAQLKGQLAEQAGGAALSTRISELNADEKSTSKKAKEIFNLFSKMLGEGRADEGASERGHVSIHLLCFRLFAASVRGMKGSVMARRRTGSACMRY